MDGAIFFDLQKVGIDAIVRYYSGKTLMAASFPKSTIPSLIGIETLAILEAYKFVYTTGFIILSLKVIVF